MTAHRICLHFIHGEAKWHSDEVDYSILHICFFASSGEPRLQFGQSYKLYGSQCTLSVVEHTTPLSNLALRADSECSSLLVCLKGAVDVDVLSLVVVMSERQFCRLSILTNTMWTPIWMH